MNYEIIAVILLTIGAILIVAGIWLFAKWDIPRVRKELKGLTFTDNVETYRSVLQRDSADLYAAETHSHAGNYPVEGYDSDEDDMGVSLDSYVSESLASGPLAGPSDSLTPSLPPETEAKTGKSDRLGGFEPSSRSNPISDLQAPKQSENEYPAVSPVQPVRLLPGETDQGNVEDLEDVPTGFTDDLENSVQDYDRDSEVLEEAPTGFTDEDDPGDIVEGITQDSDQGTDDLEEFPTGFIDEEPAETDSEVLEEAPTGFTDEGEDPEEAPTGFIDEGDPEEAPTGFIDESSDDPEDTVEEVTQDSDQGTDDLEESPTGFIDEPDERAGVPVDYQAPSEVSDELLDFEDDLADIDDDLDEDSEEVDEPTSGDLDIKNPFSTPESDDPEEAPTGFIDEPEAPEGIQDPDPEREEAPTGFLGESDNEGSTGFLDGPDESPEEPEIPRMASTIPPATAPSLVGSDEPSSIVDYDTAAEEYEEAPTGMLDDDYEDPAQGIEEDSELEEASTGFLGASDLPAPTANPFVSVSVQEESMSWS